MIRSQKYLTPKALNGQTDIEMQPQTETLGCEMYTHDLVLQACFVTAGSALRWVMGRSPAV